MNNSSKDKYPRYTWKEYTTILKDIYSKVSSYLNKNNESIDVVVPIMRGGAIPGTYLAYKLGVLSVFPVYYHYDFRSEGKMKLRSLGGIERYADLIPSKSTILLVEGNQCFGNTAKSAMDNLRSSLENAKILYVSDLVDYGHRDVVEAEASFFGKFTNECNTLTEAEARNKNIFPGTKLLPWEIKKEEEETLKTRQFGYSDLDHYFRKSKIVKEIDLDK